MAREGAFTRAELIEATGLSAPTVGSLATSLIRAGSAYRSGLRSVAWRAPSGPHGVQPAARVRCRHRSWPHPDTARCGRPAGRAPDASQCEHPRGQRASRLAQHTRARDAGAPARSRCAVRPVCLPLVPVRPALSIPATGTIVALAPNLPGWDQVPVAAILRTALDAPVVVENDVNLAVLGEHWKGAAREHDNCVFLSFGTGIGAGILVNGHLHHGHHALAGEIGLMCMGPQFVNVDFAARGCLETLAGTRSAPCPLAAGRTMRLTGCRTSSGRRRRATATRTPSSRR